MSLFLWVFLVSILIKGETIIDIGPDVSLCDGNCTTLNASGAGAGSTYLWSDGSSREKHF